MSRPAKAQTFYPSGTIRRDFDRIALDVPDVWTHNSHYYGYLLRQWPGRVGEALDVGCGAGDFVRLLAGRSQHVTGIDLSPEMIRLATERSRGYPNVDFQVADVLEYDLPPATYDCISSIATLHHMPFEEILARVKQALRPGGTLLVLDLYNAAGPLDLLLGAVALPISWMLRLVKRGSLRMPLAARQAWAEHGRHDSYLTLPEVRRVAARLLPGARVRRHLLFRYSLVWTRR